MNSPEKPEFKDTSKVFLSIAAAVLAGNLVSAVLFVVENPKEINNLPTQVVSNPNHSLDTLVSKQ